MGNYVALHGAYRTNNFGDHLILAIQANFIRETSKNKVLLPFAINSFDNVIGTRERAKGIRSLNQCRYLIYGAGGYFGEPSTNQMRWGLRFFKYHCLPGEYAIFRNMPYAVIGVGAGPVTNLLTRNEIRRICNHASVITVRDIESKEYLVEYGVSSEKILVTADVALSLDKDDLPYESIQKANEILGNNSNRKKYGIHINGLNSGRYGEKVKILLKECIEFIKKNNDILPVLIIDHEGASDQIQVVDYLSKEFDGNCVVVPYQNPWVISAILEKLDLVLTTKLHVGIVSYALGTQPLCFPTHQKTKRFYKQIKQEGACYSLDDLTPGTVLDVMNTFLQKGLMDNKDQGERREIRSKLRNQSLLNKEEIKHFLLTSK